VGGEVLKGSWGLFSLKGKGGAKVEVSLLGELRESWSMEYGGTIN